MPKITEKNVWRIAGKAAGPGAKREEILCSGILLAAAAVGPNVRLVARFLGRPNTELYPWWTNFKKGGLFRGGKIAAGEWATTGDGISFVADVAVGLGYLEKVDAE